MNHQLSELDESFKISSKRFFIWISQNTNERLKILEGEKNKSNIRTDQYTSGIQNPNVSIWFDRFLHLRI